MGSFTSADDLSTAFRQHIPDLNSPRFTLAKSQDPYSYTGTFINEQRPPWLFNLTQAWKQLYSEPYTGVTTDGTVVPDLFHTQDEGVPIDDIAKAATNVLNQLSPEQTSKVSYPINAKEWRAWSNPEMLLRPFGLRLEEVAEPIAEDILRVIEASFSPTGYQKALGAMRINHFLGEVCEVPKIMNKYSYNFLLFGTPSSTEAWGWSFYGHHLCLSVFLKGPQIIISPTFTGAEPNLIDTGEFKGTTILQSEAEYGLKLMQSLPDAAKEKATIYKLLRDPAMRQTGDLITDRWNQDDQRHVCGAFRDNRVVPNEGVCVADLSNEQQQLILNIAEEFLLYLPESARQIRKEQIRSHFDQTFFCWIGGHGDDDPFYYRVQSPVIIFEFDHHSGVFLSNEKPAKFHTHTIVRTPNAGDYGGALRKSSEML